LQCTNKKAWKDIAAQLGIGPSSSGAYTLKKHYGKNLLPFECHYERGGVDPAPILAQVEAASKKKGKGPRPPSPGSQVGPGEGNMRRRRGRIMTNSLSQDDCQDSRDSFTGNSQDGYPGYPPQYNTFPAGDPRQGAGPPQQHPGNERGY
jgi:AT-rich interactive domain-containing protein 1